MYQKLELIKCVISVITHLKRVMLMLITVITESFNVQQCFIYKYHIN